MCKFRYNKNPPFEGVQLNLQSPLCMTIPCLKRTGKLNPVLQDLGVSGVGNTNFFLMLQEDP